MISDQLKRSILKAAIEGKLTKQFPEDGDARDLLEETQKEKARLIKEGKIDKEKPLPSISEEEVPFELPDKWAWVRLIDLISFEKNSMKRGPFGGSLRKEIFVKQGYLIYEQRHAIHGDFNYEKYFITTQKFEEMKAFKVSPGDLIISCSGVTLGRISEIPKNAKEGIINQALLKLKLNNKLVRNDFFINLFNSTIFQTNIFEKAKGSAIPNMVGVDELKQIVIGLPPMAEQERIVNRINEILPETDKLKDDESKLDILQKAFPKKMKDSILQDAIEGKLTEQLESDGNARDLLKDIQKEKTRLVKEGKIKTESPHTEAKEDEVPFDIPENWCWVKLGEVFNIARGGSPRPIEAFLTTNSNGINWIKIGDTDIGGKYINKTKERIKPEGLKKSRLVYPGDLLLTNSMSFGRPYILNTRGCIHDGWLVLRPLSKKINKEYFFHLLSSNFIHMAFAKTVAGAVVKNLNSDKVRAISVPLPPVEEQKRIVNRLEEILPEIAKLEKDISKFKLN